MSSVKLEMIVFVAALFVIAVNCYSIRPKSFDLLLPFNHPEIFYRSLGGGRNDKRSALEDEDQKVAQMIYNVLYDTAVTEEQDAINNNHKAKRDLDLFNNNGQKRQSMRRSNFDILAGGGLGKK